MFELPSAFIPGVKILAGKRQLREAMKALLCAYSNKQVTVVPEEIVERSVINGMKCIFEYAKEKAML